MSVNAPLSDAALICSGGIARRQLAAGFRTGARSGKSARMLVTGWEAATRIRQAPIRTTPAERRCLDAAPFERTLTADDLLAYLQDRLPTADVPRVVVLDNA